MNLLSAREPTSSMINEYGYHSLWLINKIIMIIIIIYCDCDRNHFLLSYISLSVIQGNSIFINCNTALTVLGQNGSGQNGTDKMVWTKWYTDKMVLDKMVRTKWYG